MLSATNELSSVSPTWEFRRELVGVVSLLLKPENG
jgi:hypothetical protein